MSTTMTICIDDDTQKQLGKLAASTMHSESFLVTEAIKAYIEMTEWQRQEIEAALVEADDGDFASNEEIHTVMEKWLPHGG